MTKPGDTTTAAEKAGFSLWQERAPQGPWFLQTPLDGHVFFGGDHDSAQQCFMAIGRLCLSLNTTQGKP